MTNSVTFPPSVGGDGSTYTDDANPSTGLANGGFRARLIPMLTQTIVAAGFSVTKAQEAAASATNAADSAAAASASAEDAASAATASADSATASGNASTTASQWASLLGAQVAGVDNSAKAYAIGAGANAPAAGSAKDWATKAAGTVDGAGYSALYWAGKAADSATAAATSSGIPSVIGMGGKYARVKADESGLEYAEIKPIDEVLAPTNTSPAASAVGVLDGPTLTGSAFYSLYGAAQMAVQVQVATAVDFAAPVHDSGSKPAATSYALPSGTLAVNTVYYWRMRYQNARGTWSAWSTPTSFTTAASFNNYIATPTATPAIGAALEGGFYAGMIWNELVQSATSTAIGTGTKTFTVPDMSSAPIVYAGQSLEVRSRANPANKMIGTVTAALGTNLTINITSVGGAGTFTDWSIMTRYRVIVAPKASGESASLAYKNTNDAAPAACGTLTEGRKATLAMVAAGNATIYPAANFCTGLSIGGKTDWYLPARDELELAWRNLKPTTDANYVTADRPTGQTPNYQNLGAYGDTAATHGTNNNSAPAGTAYTGGAPAQTAAAAFQTGGAEAFTYGSSLYWSASEYSATGAWSQSWNSSSPGYQNNGNKTSAYRVRAVRRSII
jgi:hypothetical protein